MGSFFSVQSRSKRRRSNRLSKPPSNISTPVSVNSSLHTPNPSSPISPISTTPTAATWQSPWTGTSIPIASPRPELNGRRSQSSRCVSLKTETGWVAASETNRANSVTKEPDEFRIHSSASSSNTSGTLSRQASFQPSRQTAFQPMTLRSEAQSPLSRSGQPRRSYSVHSPPHRAKSTMYATSIDEAASSNTHFLVDCQGFPLIRQRSLLTQPGVATRRSTKNANQRYPSPVSQEAHFISDDLKAPQPTQWPPSTSQVIESRHPLSLAQFRPPTPNNFEYTHLGALKLGSLRVVNGSTSPCPSDRTQFNQCRSPITEPSPGSTYPIGSERTAGRHEALSNAISVPAPTDNTECRYGGPSLMFGSLSNRIRDGMSAPILQTQHLPEVRRYDDSTASPFSFDQSLKATNPHTLCENETGDEGIFIPDDDKSIAFRLGKTSSGNHWQRRQSRSHKKDDSGYSSAASIRSLQGSRNRTSLDSHMSTRRPSLKYRRFSLEGNAKDIDRHGAMGPLCFSNHLPLSLTRRGSKVDHRPETSNWVTNMSTMCHEPPQRQGNGRTRSLSNTTRRASIFRTLSLPRYCAHLRSQDSAATEMSISSLRFTNTIEMGNRGQEALCRQPCCGLSKLNMNCGCEKKDPTRIDASNQNTLNCSGVFDNAFPRATEIHRTYLSKGLGQAYYTNPDSECNSRAIKLWCSRPGVDDSAIQIKPAPEIVEGMTYEDIPNLNLEIPRGRPRSRSDEYQRHQLSKQQQRRSIYTAKSPLVVSR